MCRLDLGGGSVWANTWRMTLFIFTARILWVASLKCTRDENGNDRLPDMNTSVDLGIIR